MTYYNPRSVLDDPQVVKALLHALDRIEIRLAYKEVAELRDIVRVLVDPYDPKSRALVNGGETKEEAA